VVALWRGSATTLHDRLGVPNHKLRTIPNGVPSDRFPPIDRGRIGPARRELGLDEDRPVVLSIGALVPEKGVDLAIRAVAEQETAQLLVVGDGPERASLETLADRAAPGRVTFVGSLVEPRPCFEAADAIVLPSRGGDSMPAVLIEAGFMGVPAVATPVEGIVEILDHGEAGELVPRDDVAALAGALRRLITDAGHADRVAAAARARCHAEYDIDVVAAKWGAVLDEARQPDR
jgi:glycosyltransferase involved in cell wall biosynthesis